MADLLAVLINLFPVEVPEGFKMPRWWGNYVHGLLMGSLGVHDPALAEYVHNLPGYKPFTVSDLIGASPRQALQADTAYQVRLTSLEPRLTGAMEKILQEGVLADNQKIALGGVVFKIASHDLHSPDWCGLADYRTLGADGLMPGKALSRTITFQFGSPTTFKYGEQFDPLPSPEQVFSGLLKRWNHWSPVGFPGALLEYVKSCLVTTRYGLRTRLAGTKDGGLRPGAVGRITYTALNFDGYWLSQLHTLAAYARYAGVGSGATLGMGQARALSTGLKS